MVSEEAKDAVIIESVKKIAKQVIEERGYDEFVDDDFYDDDEEDEMDFDPDSFVEELMMDDSNLDLIFEVIYNDPVFAEREWDNSFRDRNELEEYLSEAKDRVWLVRTQNTMHKIELGTINLNPDIEAGMHNAIERITKKYDIDFDEYVTDWDYGYWSGIMAALRWVIGMEKDFLDC